MNSGKLSRIVKKQSKAILPIPITNNTSSSNKTSDIMQSFGIIQSSSSGIHTLLPQGQRIINNLNENLKTSFYALTDVSDYYLTMRLSGPKSIEVLSKACPLNFEKNLLKKNSCAQSYISKATVLIDRLSDEPIFDISVRWSFAEYLWDWLADSSSEFVISE